MLKAFTLLFEDFLESVAAVGALFGILFILNVEPGWAFAVALASGSLSFLAMAWRRKRGARRRSAAVDAAPSNLPVGS